MHKVKYLQLCINAVNMFNYLLLLITRNAIVDTQCSGGKVYTDCGSACPTTCETYGRELSCPAVCVSGCYCPVGTEDKNGTCIDPLQCPTLQGKYIMLRKGGGGGA